MKYWQKPYFIIVCVSLIVFLGLSVLRINGLLQTLELLSYDSLFYLRPDSQQENLFVLISETEADIQRYGHPLSDEVLANSLQKLLEAKANVIGVDKYRDMVVPPGTEQLKQLLKKNANIIWIFFVGNNNYERIEPPTILKESGQIGFNDTVNDHDNVSRRGLLFLDDNDTTHYAFSLRLALYFLKTKQILPKNDEQGYLRLGPRTFLPLQANTGGYVDMDAAGYQFLLSYPHLHKTFPTFSISELLDNKVPPEQLRNKIILIGSMASSLDDYVALPNSSTHYGLELHAHITDQLIETALYDTPLIYSWSESMEYAWLLLWCLLGSLVSLYRANVARLLLICLAGLLILAVSAVVVFQQGLWLAVLPAALAWLLSLILGVFWFANVDRNERRLLLQLFERHVSPQVATTLWEKREEFFTSHGVKPDQMTATVLFTDLANFTTLAEGMNPLTLMNWLNEYMEAMSNIIIAESGMINKYIGDAIMAVFGVPVKKMDQASITIDALNAVESAVRMREQLQKLNSHWQQQGLPTVTMRIGIHTGLLVAGTLGGEKRMEYTVIGDTVNTASRLESFDKTIDAPKGSCCRILIGEPTWQLVHDHYVTEKIGECQLKGKHNMLNIYCVLDRVI